ncbi:MAG TPA: crosslink repair DNA glycosylase YcaQ family protein [Acidimicrobiales bacterium]
MTVELSADEARRLALRAQGFGRGRPTSGSGLRSVIDTIHVLQVDPINVLARAQYLPVYSRRGPYPTASLDHLTATGELFEYFAHDASLLPIRLYPLLRWRMEAWSRDPRWTSRLEPGLADTLVRHLELNGPSTSSALADAAGRPAPAGPRPRAWGSTPVRTALRWLWASGVIVTRGRKGVEHVYDLPERAVPAELRGPAPDADEARRQLLLLAAGALGVATTRDLADYFRLGGGVAGRVDGTAPGQPVAALIADLVHDGRLLPARVEGWTAPAYVDPAGRPGVVRARSLVSPFDSLVWERDRVRRLFGFDYRLEIYVPRASRVHGYYVYPFLLGRELVARVDLKADRAGGSLLVLGAFVEPGHAARPGAIAAELADELALMAGWLGLERVVVSEVGDLAGPLAGAVGR